MRLHKPLQPKPKIGDLRETKRFAWIPRRIGEHVIWLEWFIVVEEYDYHPIVNTHVYRVVNLDNTRWVTIEEKLYEP